MNSVNPSMLTIARESRRQTQAELARAMNIVQGRISKAENGQVPVSEELASLYAKHLDYPPAFFYEDHEPRKLPLTLFRKRKKISALDLKAIQAKRNILVLHLRKLLRSVEVPKNKVPSVQLDDYAGRADLVARELRIQWHLPDGPVSNLTKIIEDAGVVVVSCDFGTRQMDGLSFYQPEDGIPPIIMVNSGVPGDRLRFTLAHEMGHIVLHHHLPIVPMECEEEADAFASEFLMPSALIRGFLSNVTIEKLANLKGYWRMSMASLLRKASDLGGINERQKRFLWMRMGQLGYRSKEPVAIPRDEPSLITEILRYHTETLGYTEDQLGDLLSARPGSLHEDYPGIQRGLRVVR